MRIPFHSLLILSAFPVTMLPLTAGEAGESEAPTIVTKSPFLPPNFVPPGGGGADASMPASASQYEFRGVYQMDGQYYFNLYNKRDMNGTWLTESSSGDNGPRIIRYDLDADVLVVEVAGEQVNLEMVETSDRTLPVAAGRPTTTRTAQASPATPQSRATQSASPTTPVRRRVIRPASRTTPSQSPAVRRPTIQASNSQKQNP